MTACDANEQTRHVPSLSHVAYRRGWITVPTGGMSARTNWKSHDDSVHSIGSTRIRLWRLPHDRLRKRVPMTLRVPPKSVPGPSVLIDCGGCHVRPTVREGHFSRSSQGSVARSSSCSQSTNLTTSGRRLR